MSVFVPGPGPRRDDLEVHGPSPHSCGLDPNGHIRAVGICAFPRCPRVREDRRDPPRLDGRELCDRQASLREQCSPISRRCRRGRVRGSLRRVDLYRDGQQADQPTCLIERQRHHPGTRGGRIQRRHDIGAANWHQPPGALPVPEEQRRRLRRGERAPSRGRSVVLVDVPAGSRYRSHIRRLHRLPDPRSRDFAAAVCARSVRACGPSSIFVNPIKLTSRMSGARSDQPHQHAGKTESADRRRQRARLSSCGNHVGRRRFTGGHRRCERVSSG